MIKKLLDQLRGLVLLLALYWRTRHKGNWAGFRLGMWIERMKERFRK